MNFEFPDIADFPENEAPVRPDCGAPDFATDFDTDLAELKLGILDFLGEKENAILNQQLARVKQARTAYAKKSGPVIPGDGIITWKAPVNRLQAFFAEDIKRTKEIVPPDDIKSIDRATTRKDPSALKIVSDFLGVQAKSVTVHVSNPGDKHHRQQFADCKTVTRLLNLHVDPKPGIVKAIIYLSDVTLEDGPFQFIRRSNEWKVDHIQRIFAWGNSVGNYLHTPEHRRVANAFPSRFRRNAIIGRLIADDSRLGNYLLEKLTTYTSDKANVMIFDPCYNFHRGGQCRSGQRINLQVVLQ